MMDIVITDYPASDGIVSETVIGPRAREGRTCQR